ncbi:MAG: DUF4271 domain-containing protein [Bacteroidota bacterium]
MKKSGLIILLSLMGAVHCLASDTLVIKDFSNEWLYFNPKSENYQPLVEPEKFKGNTLHFKVERSGIGDDYLQVIGKNVLSIFNGKRLIDIVQSDTFMLPLQNLSPNAVGQFPITLYAKDIDPETVQAKIVRLANIDSSPISNVAVSYKRERSSFSEFLVFSLLILTAIGAALYNYFPRVSIEYLKVSRAFSIRESEENLLKSRPLSLVNIYFYTFFSLLCGLVFLSLFHLAKLQVPGFNRIYINTIWYGLWLWLQISFAVLFWLLLKLLLIYNIARLFQLGSFSPNHFFNYVRILLITLLCSIAVLVLNFFTLSIVNPVSYNTFLLTLLVVFGLTVLMIYLKLMGASGLKSLHLFSYLCSTELVPYGIILSLGISQAI